MKKVSETLVIKMYFLVWKSLTYQLFIYFSDDLRENLKALPKVPIITKIAQDLSSSSSDSSSSDSSSGSSSSSSGSSSTSSDSSGK